MDKLIDSSTSDFGFQMSSFKSKSILFLLSVILSINAVGQVSITDSMNAQLNKNIIYGTTTLFRYALGASANYERIVKYKENALLKYTLIKVSYGAWADWMDGGNYFITGFSGLSGSKASHFESHIGLAVLYFTTNFELGLNPKRYQYEPQPSKFEYLKYYPSVAMGYRYQKPGGFFVFRTGAGFPEYLYMSLGFCF